MSIEEIESLIPDSEIKNIDTGVALEEPVISDEDVAPTQEPVNETVETPVEPAIPEPEKTPEVVNKCKQYQVKYRYTYPCNNWNDDNVTLEMPSLLLKDSEAVLNQIPNMAIAGNPEADEWVTTLDSSVTNYPPDNLYLDTVNDEKANFSQSVEYKGKELLPTELKTNFSGKNLTGEKAIIAFSKAIGIGDLVQVPLWHSGIWVTFKTPTEMEIIQLNRELADEKIKLGRATEGMSFFNLMSYTLDKITRFCINHIFDTTLQATALEEKDYRDIIRLQDYPILTWGLLCSMYPRGFQYRRACLSDPEKCNYVAKETLSLPKLQWTNLSALDESHINHMSDRKHKNKTLQSVLDYQSSLPIISDQVVTIDEETNLKVTIKTPSINEYVQAGENWISNIVSIVDQVATNDPKKNDKDTLITRYAQATALRQLAHWVKSIEFGENIIEDSDTVNKILDVISQQDNHREKIIKEVTEYINHSTLSLIGIPVYNCPKCGEKQSVNDESSQFANIIPLDVTSIFFDQHVQRIRKISNR